MITATDQGTVVSVDGGQSWTSWYNQPTAQFYHVTTDNQFPYYVYGAQQDSGTVATASRSDYGSITYRDWYSVGAGESGYIAPDPGDSNTVYGGSTYGRLFRFDKRTGQSQDISPSAVEEWTTPITDKKLRFTWTSPVVFSPHDAKTLYMGAQYVLRSTGRGSSWQQISPDFTGCDVARTPSAADQKAKPVSNENAVARCYGVVYTIAPSPVEADVIWTGTDSGRIFLTRDGGKTWQNVTPSSLGDWSKISMIETSHFGAATAYAAVDRHRLDDFAPHIYRTGDLGKSWRGIAAGIPAAAFVHAVREDPKRKGLLYAATEMGVYVSFNDGDNWLPLKLNLPVVPVHDLVVHDNDLVIATHGRSFWILDDLTPLRQISREVAQSAAYFFAPQTAMRVRSDVARDTPLPPEEPAGENPPSGAILDYYLGKPAGEVVLEILDSRGALVRRFSSANKFAPPPANVAFTGSWFALPGKLATTAGEHRFTWDLRYPDPPSLRKNYDISAVYGVGVTGLPRGPLVLPGKYEVRLTVDGTANTQRLTVQLDPRLKVSAADLQKQFELETQISEAMRQAYVALPQPQSRSSSAEAQDTQRNPLVDTLSKLASLLSVVDTADEAPTRQAQEAWEELRARLAQELQHH